MTPSRLDDDLVPRSRLTEMEDRYARLERACWAMDEARSRISSNPVSTNIEVLQAFAGLYEVVSSLDPISEALAELDRDVS